MKPSEDFIKVIQVFLDGQAKNDPLFAEKLKNEDKSIEECCDFIASELAKKKFGQVTDQEVYGLAMHYYDEEKVEFTKVKYNVIVPVVDETPEPKENKPKKSKKKFTSAEIEEFEKRQLSIF
ncbi:MAG: Cas9 inhibitor AcrIIA9 family protein [Bacteroides sp.]|uniref:Cas9 inhibitor AcrIIA9 family protein n=1 Tax=Bacteroides sp. TaxID=29523 RepID=UPI002FC74E80